jgi:hypothetical protein
MRFASLLCGVHMFAFAGIKFGAAGLDISSAFFPS